MAEIKIYVNEQLDGYTYRLDPQSKAWVQRQEPRTKPVASVFLSFDAETPLEWKEGTVWQHVAEMLTGLPGGRLKELGKVVFVDPTTKAVLFDTVEENV